MLESNEKIVFNSICNKRRIKSNKYVNFNTMKMVILSLFMFITCSSLSQVKKRDQGVYKGLIPGYAINTGQDLIQVDSSTLQIRLEKNQIMIKIEDKVYEGTYQVHQKIKRKF